MKLKIQNLKFETQKSKLKIQNLKYERKNIIINI